MGKVERRARAPRRKNHTMASSSLPSAPAELAQPEATPLDELFLLSVEGEKPLEEGVKDHVKNNEVKRVGHNYKTCKVRGCRKFQEIIQHIVRSPDSCKCGICEISRKPQPDSFCVRCPKSKRRPFKTCRAWMKHDHECSRKKVDFCRVLVEGYKETELKGHLLLQKQKKRVKIIEESLLNVGSIREKAEKELAEFEEEEAEKEEARKRQRVVE